VPLLARDFGIVCGTLPTGRLNAITDVPGVLVGHRTLRSGEVNTGVTAILPHGRNLYREKVRAATDVINGFGKSMGLIQIDELGTIETPILLTNTFSVSACAAALIRTAIDLNPDIGRETATVNPVVCECNDGALNDIQALAVTEEDARAAIANAGPVVTQGSVGAGTGMSCFGFKGGIGTASRHVTLGGEDRHLGVLVLSNFGRAGDLVLPDGRRPRPADGSAKGENGSVIVILATDADLEHRQLARVTKRCAAGLARLGAFWGNGSGDIAIGFNPEAIVRHDDKEAFSIQRILNEKWIDVLFQAAAEATMEAVLNSLCAAGPFEGWSGAYRPSLADWLAGSTSRFP
jgi:D-aminopeptidase